MATQRLWVKGMRPEDEARAAERLRAVDGVLGAVPSARGEWADVDLDDDRASLDDVRRALHEMGYESGLAG